MCGLAGILRTDGEPIPDGWLDALDDAIAPRGPDGHGRARARHGDAEVAFVHRRLAILDQAGGAQPMSVDDAAGTVTVVFNGCIYNHRAVRADLVARGHLFRSDHADTETLPHGWRAHGRDLPAHLEGMYAFALWDQRRGELFLARDPFGEKPLWIAQPRPGVLAFASVAAPLVRLFPESTRAASPAAVADFLRRGCGWCADGGALAPLPPGSWLSARADGSIERGRHHRTPDAGDGEAPTVDDVSTAVDAAVRLRLEADVPLGCFLSGGVDSALVAATAMRQLGRLRTFCVRMPDASLDESTRAAAIAAALRTDHTTLDATAQASCAADDLVTLTDSIGVPFGDSSLLPMHWVSRAARQAVTVALSGDGGDELFLGYRRHVWADPIARFAWALRQLPRSLGARAARVRDIADDLPALGAAAFGAALPERLVRALVPDAPAPTPVRIGHHAHAALVAVRRLDVDRYLPDDLLLKVDTASMAVALEVRAPLLDRSLARMALAAPIAALRRADGRRGRKAMLRAVLRRHLPAHLVDGPKRGFAIPIGRWWRDDVGGLGTLLRDAFASASPFGSLPVDPAAARRLADDHLTGRAEHGQRLLPLLSLALWAQRADRARSRPA